MWLRECINGRGGARRQLAGGGGLALLVALIWLAVAALPAMAHEAAPMPAMDNMMSSAGWMQGTYIRLEREAVADARMLPETPSAIVREWRTFDRDGSALGALINVAWVALAALLALAAERGTTRGLGRRLCAAVRRPEGPTVGGLLLLLMCDVAGLLVFAAVFVSSRHWMGSVSGVTPALLIFSAKALFRWRTSCVVARVVLRPYVPPARLITMPDDEAKRLYRFLAAVTLAIILLIGFGRYGLMDVDAGAPHVIALMVAVIVCSLYAWIVFHARGAFEALIRGRTGGLLGAFRAALARAWIAVGLTLIAGLFLFFVFGLSLGLLPYYQGTLSTVGVWFVLLVLDRLTECGWRHSHAAAPSEEGMDHLVASSLRRMLRAMTALVAVVVLTWVWIDAIERSPEMAGRATIATVAAAATLFVAYIAWELVRLTIDRNLQSTPAGPKLPGDDEVEAGPGSRLQTVLPLMRVVIGALIAVVATLVVLSRLGIDTAPLIAGASVFGLAISFGSQSLVRDVISGLFYMWDDAFRIGEYIDTGRLKGTVEALGIRSVKVRHHNGPLHTIPYGQLGAVTNMSRDFATIKFNLRFEPGTDIELVRKAAKRIGIEMQEEAEIASEVMLPLKMQGIAEVADTAVVLRFKFTARPIKPSWIQREYLKRMYRVFAEQGIRFASGTLTLTTMPPFPDVSPQHGSGAEVLSLATRQLEEAATAAAAAAEVKRPSPAAAVVATAAAQPA